MKALLAAAAMVLLVAGCGGGERAQDLPRGKKVAATARLDPTVHVFAEPVTAVVEVAVDREEIDPDRVRVETAFLPYDVKAERRSTERRGGLTVLRREYVLRCLRIGCIPEILSSAAGEAETGRGERRALRLPAARVLYDDPGGETRVLQRVPWPEVVSVSRLKQSDIPEFGDFVFKTSVTPLPKLDFRVPPTVLGIALLVVAAALLALPAILVARWYRRRRPVEVVAEEVALTPLERAVRLVEWAGERENGAERREALEVLAVELDAANWPELARSARALAWSPASPPAARAADLVAEVRRVDGAG
jgi:hypothetical protein